MESGYSFAESLPPAFSPDYEAFLFHDPRHLMLQTSEWSNFYLLKNANRKSVAQVSFHVQNNKAISPVRSPFGSFLFSEQLPPLILYEFIQECEKQLRKRGVRFIALGEPPLFYRKSGELLMTLLLNLGYRVSTAELSAGIRVDKANFEQKIESWEKRKLKQAKAKGLLYRSVPFDQLEKVYDFILKCRKQRGHSLSMTLENLNRTAETFKDRFFLFGAYFEKELAAASIAIHVHSDILYNFYSGHLKKFDPLSPVVLLMEGMYKFCRSRKIQILDLGTSSLQGKPNFSLLEFKMRLGAIPAMKLTFEKELV